MKTRLLKLWREWRNTALFFGLVIVPVKSVLADLNWVPTESMNPTILEGDLVYVDKAAYDLRVLLSFDLNNWLKSRLSRFGEALQ